MTVAPVESLLEIRDLSVEYGPAALPVRAVINASLSVARGEVVGLVGESGSGKSTLGQAIVRLVEFAGGRITSGAIAFEGSDIVGLPARNVRELRGSKIGMVFQNPMASLNPTYRVGAQLREALDPVRPGRASWERCIELLGRVGLSDARRRALSYPHELSGGMRQRVMIAMALGPAPQLVIADEPTSALDVTIQAQVLWVLEDMRQTLGTAMLLITHNMALAASFCDRIAVMYHGRILESGPAKDVLRNPAHPYTQALVASIPSGNWRTARIGKTKMADLPASEIGCPYRPLCARRIEACGLEFPAMLPYPGAGSTRAVACFSPLGHREISGDS
jgi:oligopeptide/dipeptide ABC transporter ATP-binding protein